MTPELLALQSATVRFGPKVALRGVNLSVARGERIALLGANGSGKSTLLRAAHGLVPLAEGRRIVGAATPVRFAMVFQRPFMLRSSAQANVELGLMLQGVPPAQRRERAAMALERVGLAAEAGRIGRVLSAGQQQRVALARAWALQPDVLLLDEPTSSLDPTAKREVESLIEEFAAQGITVLMSSHNLGQVKRLANRVVYLEHGRLLADVTTDHFFNGPLPVEATLFLKGELPWD
ncbi:phosphate ABC transporter ATP-binding protein [Piscinibacter sp.]|uniref:ABC transporter ATP-binding protein n=1 Tax=Piscinibacter sp. TaxID=1903157 RepID=UPI002CFA096F|nr:phosphate ABC transporter ATP-binding protein [Albitalea sp.]HUG25109.1 phosphate ABC transporter ATP-binding protein [Albitalea sp.]